MFVALRVLRSGGGHTIPSEGEDVVAVANGGQSVRPCQAAVRNPGNDKINVNNAGKNFFMGMKKNGERNAD
jgi:hypothetical protein